MKSLGSSNANSYGRELPGEISWMCPPTTGVPYSLEAVSKILAEQDEDAAEVDEAEVVGGMIFIADHQPPEVA